MKIEAWIFGLLVIFFAVVTPIYWFISHEITGTAALILTFFLVFMIAGYFGLIARRIDARPEDKKEGEIAEGAGELGFFPPKSIYPLLCGATFAIAVLAPVFGWWLLFLASGMGIFTITGWVYEFYRGDYAH